MASRPPQQAGWQVLLFHLNATKQAYRPLAAFLWATVPEWSEKQAKRLAERTRRGPVPSAAELDMLDAGQATILASLLQALHTEYQAEHHAQDDERHNVARLKKQIPLDEVERLTMLRELANGKALSGQDLVQAQLRTEAAVRSWLALSAEARQAWFQRVETVITAREKQLPPGEPPLFSTQYRRLYMRPKPQRRVAPQDDYRILGLAPGAAPEEIKRAFRQQAFRHHPDRNGDPAAFMAVQRAYHRLLQESE